MKISQQNEKIQELRNELVTKFNAVMEKEPLFIFIDEASSLLKQSSVRNQSKLDVLRKASQTVLKRKFIDDSILSAAYIKFILFKIFTLFIIIVN